MSKSIHNPHDRIFHASLKHPKVTKEFLNLFLPDSVKKDMNFNQVTYCNTTFIDESLKLQESDVLLKTEINNQPAFIYILCEHQTKVDKWMPFRLFKYMLAIWEMHITEKGEKDALPLPVIFPLVFYTGKKAYHGQRALWELCSDPQKMQAILTEPFHLVDTTALPESMLNDHRWAGTLSFVMRQQFKAQFKESVLALAKNLEALWGEDRAYVLKLIAYILAIDETDQTPEEFVSLFKGKVSNTLEHEIMGLAEKIEQRGVQKGIERGIAQGVAKGIEKGKLETAKKMLAAGVELAFIAKMTDLSVAQLEALKKSS
ncbi:MAG: Rpn family recombination-promoting nuclease/putative transposase [Legionella sp.]|nr:Rpn family recombination-promoting nuclease/putative transposase [Legionella sp.]